MQRKPAPYNEAMLPVCVMLISAIELFDGKSLAGWVNEGGANFRVEAGAIVVDRGPYSWLRTDKQYADYELKLEYKTTADGNSGVFLRSASQGKPHETGYELQIFDERKDYRTGSIVGIIEARPNRIRAGKWNTIEVRHHGPRVTVKMNGQLVVDTKDRRSSKGYIGLQFNPGKPISFRKIRIREI